jgi:hypothetical protein
VDAAQIEAAVRMRVKLMGRQAAMLLLSNLAATEGLCGGGWGESREIEVRNWTTLLFVAWTLSAVGGASADPVTVRHREGLTHGFLTLKTLNGVLLATGDLVQHTRGDRVTTRLTYRFKDGSTYDETTVFSQRGTFRLISDRMVQKGPTFEQPLDMSIDAASGQVTVRYKDDKGADKVESERLDLPPDVANGMMPILLKNIVGGGPVPTLSFVAATPKPRLVKLAISAAAADPFSIAGSPRKATHYVIKVEIGGLAGVVAPILGKQPPDTHVWVLGGDAPAFVKSEGPLFNGGDAWRTELTSPVWPK